MMFSRKPVALSDLHTGLTGVERLLRKADIARDNGDPEAAADIYRAALELAPDRNDVKVQLGNMLKDTGRLTEAAALYRQAQAADPDDADICVQMGHVLKLMGQRSAALEQYRRAAMLNPNSWAAVEELAEAGDSWQQQRRFEVHFRNRGADALLEMSGQLAAMRSQLETMAARLPDALAQTAFPAALYESFRTLYAVPPPPAGPRAELTVLLLADREPLDLFYRQIAALQAQTHAAWTLKVVGRSAEHERVVALAGGADPRIGWIALGEAEEPAAAEWRAAATATDWTVLLAAGAVLHPQALAWFAAAPAIAAGSVAFICDEDRCDFKGPEPSHRAPVLRQAVDYDTLLEANPFGETIAVSAAALAALVPFGAGPPGRARSRLLLDLARGGRVGHLPLPLVSIAGGRAPSLPEHRLAVADHAERFGFADRIALAKGESGPTLWLAREETAAMAVVIPTRDNASELHNFVRSLRDRAEHPDHLRIVIVENASRLEETRRLLDELGAKRYVTLLKGEEAFNWSRLSNTGARAAGPARHLVFANDDMLMLTDNWDTRLRGLLEREEVGAVGARLLYGDDTLQHAGMLFGWRNMVIHDGLYEPADAPGPARRFQVTRATAAVTGAFLATRRERFEALGGFDEQGLPVAFSDVDYALKLREAGARVLWTPAISLRHYESKTRGMDHLSVEKKARNESEMALMRARWGDTLEADPSLNPVWYPATLPFHLLAAPSGERILAHVRRTAAAWPWAVERAAE